MKILNVVYSYPPLLYPAVMCYLKLVKGLKDHGYGVDVVTVDPSSFYAPGYLHMDATLEEIVPPGVPEHRITSWESSLPFRALKSTRLSYRLFHRVLEPRKREWTYPAIHFLRKLDLKSFDILLTCSQPHANHLIGYELKLRTGLPWIAYFSDPWADNIYTDFRTDGIRDFNRREEAKVIELADAVFFTSGEMLDLVMKKYPIRLRRKCGVLPHSFVPDWYDLAARRFPEEKEGKVRFVHTGHFYGPRSPLPAIRALAELKRRNRIPDGTEFLFCGTMPEEAQRYVREQGLENHVQVMSTVPYIESLSKIVHADVLFLIDAPLSDATESVFLPSKLIDYIGSMRPVLGITPPAGACARVLRETGNLTCDLSDDRAIEESFERLFAGENPAELNTDAIGRYHYMNATEAMLDVMRKL